MLPKTGKSGGEIGYGPLERESAGSNPALTSKSKAYEKSKSYSQLSLFFSSPGLLIRLQFRQSLYVWLGLYTPGNHLHVLCNHGGTEGGDRKASEEDHECGTGGERRSRNLYRRGREKIFSNEVK